MSRSSAAQISFSFERGTPAAASQAADTAPVSAGLSKGEQIKARIAANRQKRLQIAEAMKEEAGVTGHEFNARREDLSGLAFIGTGKIRSPEGQNIHELYTVAHECGHIFLHNEAPGLHLAAHVMEMEAESYAHQAFREHGMKIPRWLSDGGRRYVGTWVERKIVLPAKLLSRVFWPTSAAHARPMNFCGWCRGRGSCTPRRLLCGTGLIAFDGPSRGGGCLSRER